LSASLAQVGLVQTADTGQINWTTVLRPAINTYAGYEIWRFSDSSLFMKWEYGTGGNATNIAIRVQVGTGSNGSGTLTGATSSATIIGGIAAAGIPNGSSRRSFLSRTSNNAFFGFVGYAAVANPDANPTSVAGSLALFCVSRTVDANTNPTTLGYTVYGKSTNVANQLTQCQGVDIPNNVSTTLTTDKAFCYVPFTITSSLIGGLPQFFTHWVPLSTSVPRVVPQFGICTVVVSEIASGVTFSANPIGAALRTFIALPACNASGAVNDPSTGSTTPIYRLAMIWE
jgi:hypothetical protein